MLTTLPPDEVLAPAEPVRYGVPRHPALRSVVSTFWSTSVPDPAPVLRVLPDAAVDLVLSARGLKVAGPDTRPSLERLEPGEVIAVQLKPEAVPAVREMRAQLASHRPLDIRALGVGERQLRRHCLAAYGYGSKTLSRIGRFQLVMDTLRAGPVRSLSDLAFESGYVDQSHPSHEVGEFSGMTPGGLRAALGLPLPGP